MGAGGAACPADIPTVPNGDYLLVPAARDYKHYKGCVGRRHPLSAKNGEMETQGLHTWEENLLLDSQESTHLPLAAP